MSWDNTKYIVEHYNTIITKYFERMESEKTFIETYDIPKATKKKNFQGFSLSTVFLNIKSYSVRINNSSKFLYYWNDYYFLEPRIVALTPEEYLRYTYLIEGKEFISIQEILNREDIIDEVVEDYKNKILNDEKQDLPYLEFIEKIFDGRHRVLGAYKAGLNTIPCMIFI